MYHHRLTLLIVVPCYRTKKDSDFFRIYYLCYNRDCTLYSFIPLKSGPNFQGKMVRGDRFSVTVHTYTYTCRKVRI